MKQATLMMVFVTMWVTLAVTVWMIVSEILVLIMVVSLAEIWAFIMAVVALASYFDWLRKEPPSKGSCQ